MKKLFTLILSVLVIGSVTSAQCIVRNLAVQLHAVTNNAGVCTANFDLTWEQEVNNGNKFAVIHLWKSNQYPALEVNNLAYTSSSDHPDETDLAAVLATIIIEANGTATPFIGNSYYPHPLVPVLSAGLTISKEVIDLNWERMTIKNISLVITECSGASLTGDIWASQANHGQSVQCVSSSISMVIGNPVLSGHLYCPDPRQYDVVIKNEGLASIDVMYDIYIDEGDAIYEPSLHDLKITTTAAGPFTIAAGATYNSGMQSYLPYSQTQPFSDRGLWVEVTASGIPNKAIYYIVNPCFPLPVNNTRFTAIRDQKDVKIIWQTAEEWNNYGFEIQRRSGDDGFQTIAFVPSKALNGNSTTTLFYNYTDQYPSRNIVEYRLKQIDLNTVFKLSQIVAVCGEGQDAVYTIYPNPAVNNTIKLAFKEWRAAYDVDLVDMSGRVFRKFQHIIEQTLVINNVPKGFYFVRITDRTTGIQTTRKVIVSD